MAQLEFDLIFFSGGLMLGHFAMFFGWGVSRVWLTFKGFVTPKY